MIDKPLESISLSDIQFLVDEKWMESKTLDYKRDNYGSKDEDKRELLKDVSSFANTSGGDIIIGVDESGGEPVSIPGIEISDIDAEKLRFHAIIRSGLEPRVGVAIHHLQVSDSKIVLIIRIEESQISPHRVVFQGRFGEFWARNSAGKYSMDTDELQRAFTMSDTVYQQIGRFRKDRVHSIAHGNAPFRLLTPGTAILHLVPVSAFRTRQHFDVVKMPELSTLFPPIGISPYDHRFNLDGHVTYRISRDEKLCRAYTQFFRNGIIESVVCELVEDDPKEGRLFFPGRYERDLACRAFKTLLKGISTVGVRPPIWCFLSIIGVKDARIPTDDHFEDEDRTIDRDILLLPEAAIDDLDVDAASVLRPLFDLVWNASGHSHSRNFDQKGNWIGRR